MKKYMLFLVLLACGCSKEREAVQEKAAVPVCVTCPSCRDISFYVEALGVLQPKVRAEIFPRVEGEITEIHVREGDLVQKDAPLFSIDATLHEIQVAEAQAELSVERANFSALEKKVARYKSLAQKDLIAQTEWDELEAEFEKSKGACSLHEARVQKARIERDLCTVKAPISGRVGKIHISKGLFVKAMEKPLTSITQIDSLVVECSITEKEFSEIPSFTKSIEVSPLSAPDKKAEGVITFFDSSFEEKQGVLLVRGEIVNEAHTLLPGQVVNVRIPYKHETGLLLIPQKAIKYNQEGPYVYIVQNDMTVAVSQIVVGEEYGDERIVTKGMTADDKVVIEGLERLSAGTSVQTL